LKKTFYFIRHGQTDLNRKGIVQGRGVDSPLNETGFRQARAFYEAFRGVPFDKIYTSTLLRTKQTVQLFLDSGIPSDELAGLDEISWGIYEGKEQDEAVMAGFETIVSAWRNNELEPFGTCSPRNGKAPCWSACTDVRCASCSATSPARRSA